MQDEYYKFVKLLNPDICTKVRYVSEKFDTAINIICHDNNPISYAKYFPSANKYQDSCSCIYYVYPENCIICKIKFKHEIVIRVCSDENYVCEQIRKHKICSFLCDIPSITYQVIYLREKNFSTFAAFAEILGVENLYELSNKKIHKLAYEHNTKLETLLARK
jgi:hypothetical protein